MKKLNKKGFTIVELVIVIAVIAILAAVLIPTFSGVVEKAQKSAALQACRSELVEVKAVYAMNGEDVKEGVIFASGNYAFKYENGSLAECEMPSDKKPTKLKNVIVYDISGVTIGGKDPNYYLVDSINLSGLSTVNTNEANGFTITVRNDSGTIIYKESGSLSSRDEISFDIYSNSGHLSGNGAHLTSAAPKNAEEAYGKYYTYTATNGSNVVSGIFFYTFN